MNTRALTLLAAAWLIAHVGGNVADAQELLGQPDVSPETILESDCLPEAGCAGSLYAGEPGGCYFEVGAVWLGRTLGDDVPIAEIVDARTRERIVGLTTDDFSVGLQPGLKILLGYQFDECRSIEASYIGLNNWIDRRTIETQSDDQRLNSPILIPGTGAEEYLVDSDFHNLELNIRQRFRDRGDSTCWLFYGFRYLNLQDFFLASSSFTDGGGERSGISTHNNLLIGQIGAGYTEFFGPLALGANSKLGIGANPANYEGVAFIDFGDGRTGTRSVGQDDTSFSFVFDAELTASYLVTSWFALRTGYQFIVLTGVAQANDQIASTFPVPTTPNLDNDGVVFLHGPSFSIELTWGGPRR